jgi:hypothetical protein
LLGAAAVCFLPQPARRPAFGRGLRQQKIGIQRIEAGDFGMMRKAQNFSSTRSFKSPTDPSRVRTSLKSRAAPPAAVYFYSPDRGGEHPAAHLAYFTGFLQTDAYSGFAALYEPRQAGAGLPAIPAITEVACWAHCRRSIFDVWQSTKSTVAKAALDRIAQFYAIEDKARFAPPDERLAHRTRVLDHEAAALAMLWRWGPRPTRS